jgi:HEAT repeat protein
MSTFRTKAATKENKGGINADAARDKRIGQFTQVRQQERAATLESRRRRGNNQLPDEYEDTPEFGEDEIENDRPNIPILVQNLHSNDQEVVHNATFRLRQLVSLVKNPPFDEVIAQGALPILVKLLSGDNPKVVFESAWCFTNIASGNTSHTKQVVDCGAIPVLVELLTSQDGLVRDQAVWALGNIAGESPVYRDFILSLNAMPKLLAIAHKLIRLCMLRNVSWTLSNFCRGRNPQPDFEIVSQAFPTLHNMLNFRDDDVCADAAWTLSFLSDDQSQSGDNHKIEMVLHSGVLGRLVILLSHPNPNIKTPALRTIGNLLTGSNFQLQVVLNANVLPPLVSLLSNTRKGIRREAAWALSNVAAGTRPHAAALIDVNAFHALFLAASHAEIPTKREIAWVICNAVSHRDPLILEHISGLGWIAGLLNFLQSNDVSLTLCCLDALHHFLEHGANNKELIGDREINIYAEIVERAGGDQVLQHLAQSDNPMVYHKVATIMSSFLGYVPADAEDGQDDQFQDQDGMVTFDAGAAQNGDYNF